MAMEEEKIQDIWCWTEKAEATSFNPCIRAGEPVWEDYQVQMPKHVVDAGLVERVRFCGNQIIWNLDELIRPSESQLKGGIQR